MKIEESYLVNIYLPLIAKAENHFLILFNVFSCEIIIGVHLK